MMVRFVSLGFGREGHVEYHCPQCHSCGQCTDERVFLKECSVFHCKFCHTCLEIIDDSLYVSRSEPAIDQAGEHGGCGVFQLTDPPGYSS